MNVPVRQEGDCERLDALITREKNAKQRDRLRAARLALDGKQALEIAGMLGRSRRFVQEWVYAYRDGGIESIKPGKKAAAARPSCRVTGSRRSKRGCWAASPTPTVASARCVAWMR
jgi:hypothetical protein